MIGCVALFFLLLLFSIFAVAVLTAEIVFYFTELVFICLTHASNGSLLADNYWLVLICSHEIILNIWAFLLYVDVDHWLFFLLETKLNYWCWLGLLIQREVLSHCVFLRVFITILDYFFRLLFLIIVILIFIFIELLHLQAVKIKILLFDFY